MNSVSFGYQWQVTVHDPAGGTPRMSITDTSDLWWKNAVIYCLDVETFFDSDADGIGDFHGLADRIDYLADLGITCLWLMPFYPSPDRDDGYDVTDGYGVDPRLGTHGDLVEVIRTAHDRGIRVIVDVLVNHTSDQHPWFKSAKRSKNSRFRDFYVWRSDAPPDTSDQVVFPDREDSLWAFEPVTQEWYLHHFYSFQPDLNTANPQVRNEIAKMMGFWLELGIDGFRVDAVPFFLDDIGMSAKDRAAMKDPHEYLRELRSFLSRRRGDAMLLGEVNLPHREQRQYFGDQQGDELHMMFDFISMQKMYLSLARNDARPLATALKTRPRIPADCHWATFVRNHDELTLDKLTEGERAEVFAAFGPEPQMQIYGRGLKRRLPPMLDGDPRRIRLVYSLLFALPGTPTLFYGEEIGMGEDPEADGRMAVRSPMQWSDDANGGFSTAPGRKLVNPMVTGGFGPDHVNVVQQMNDPDSLWHFVRKLIQIYRKCPELGWGAVNLIDQPHSQVLVQESSWQGRTVLTLHNFGPTAVSVPLQLSSERQNCDLTDLLTTDKTTVDGKGRVDITLDGYGYRWLRVVPPGDRRLP